MRGHLTVRLRPYSIWDSIWRIANLINFGGNTIWRERRFTHLNHLNLKSEDVESLFFPWYSFNLLIYPLTVDCVSIVDICQVIQSVYQNMSLSFLTDLLDYTDERAVEKCVAALDLGWEIDFQKDTVKIPKSEENSSEVKRSTQVMSTDSMTQILASLRM